MTKLSPRSWLVTGGRPEEPGAPLNTPLVPASNFLLGGDRVYSRDSATPGWEALETVIGGLEGGKAIAFSSGMAAVAAVFDQLSAGSLVTLPLDCYHGVAELARKGEQKGVWRVQAVAVEDTAAWIRASVESDLVWIESPSNPLLSVADLEAITAAPRKAGALFVVDNTFATPLNQQPLALGADISLHSATKFIGGHSDLLAGIVVAKDESLHSSLHQSRTVGGATPGVLEAFLALRGLRTLALRLAAAQRSAMHLADWLEQHPDVEKARYPGLASHPTHALAASQLNGFGSMISFDLRGGAEVADAVCHATQIIRHATSLGSVESTMERRAAVPGQEHLPPGLLRLSVGIESCDDIRKDLQQAFAKAGLRRG
ncbi:MAG: PLP-dependent transferase [Xanthomonadales bacterium]|jgi:cystathionine gamma-synthase|nr:PLP-dependent transferase [Xanthomonadales bacterium]